MRSSSLIAAAIGFASLAMIVLSMWGAKRFIVRAPADYFVRPPPPRSVGARVMRTIFGSVIVLAGVAMLVLPGQGVLTIVVGLLILDLPIQHKVAKWLVARPAIGRTIASWRTRAGQPPLEMPAEVQSARVD
ncbi:MAG TPA: PGPGW domain-containing protein [Polyangiaceae bacterium]|nr:PGPGW domain-containing protein [Polyangiaceae bacterium]